MVLSKRERYIAIAAAALLGLLALDQLVIEPVLGMLDAAERDRQARQAELVRATATLRHAQDLGPKWRAMQAEGLTSSASAAEAHVLRAVRNWCEEAGVTLVLLKPDRAAEQAMLSQVSFQAAGNGSMSAISRLLWRLRNATIPVRVTELQLSSRREGIDDLTVQLRLSTIYESPAPAPPGAGRSSR